LYIDKTPPSQVFLDQPLHNSLTSNQTPTLKWLASSDFSGINSYELFINGITNNITLLSNIPASLPDGVHAWRVRAIDNVGYIGSWSTASNIIIDTTPPTLPTLLTPSNFSVTNDDQPQFTWASSSDTNGVDAYKIIINGTTYNPGTNLFYTPGIGLTEGTNQWSIQVQDKAGNWSGWSATNIVIIDTTPPSQVLLDAPLNNTLTSNTTLTLTWLSATNLYGIASYDVAINGTTNNVAGLSDISPVLPEGTYPWIVRAIDTAGNIGAWSVASNIIIDTTPPLQVVLDTPINFTLTNNNTPQLAWLASSDANGIASYDVIINGTTNNIAGLNTISTALPDGTNAWMVRAIDNAGRTGAWSVASNIIVDAIAPSIPSLNNPVNLTITNDNQPQFIWNASVDTYGIASYRIRINATTYNPGASLNYTPGVALSEGTNQWRVQSLDNAGNWSGWSATNIVIIDTTPPSQVVLNTPLNNALASNTTPSLTWLAATNYYGIDSYDVVINGNTNNVAGLSDTSPVLPDGTHPWIVRAIDTAGNIGTWSVASNIIIDTTPPSTITLNTPVSNSTISAGSTILIWNIGFDAVSGLAGYMVEIDDNPAFSSPSIKTTNGLSWSISGLVNNSTNYWRVKAFDNAGFTNNWSSVWNVIIDTNQIIPTLLTPPNNVLTNNSSIDYDWSTEADVSRYWFEIRSNNTAGVLMASNTNLIGTITNLTLLEGQYVWRVRAYKTSTGAWQPFSSAFTVRIDITPPSIPLGLLPVDLTQTINTTPTFSWNASSDLNPINYFVVINGITNSAGINTNYTSATLSDGTNTWKVYAMDAAGNLSGFSSTNKILIDTTAPGIVTHNSPVSNITTASTNILFSWNSAFDSISGVAGYVIEIDDDNGFGSPYTLTTNSTNWNLTVSAQPIYYWRIRSFDNLGNTNNTWSSVWSVNIDLSAIIATLYNPSNGSVITNNNPAYRWSQETGTDRYWIEVRTNNTSGSVMASNNNVVGTNAVLSLLSDGIYIWRISVFKTNTSSWQPWSSTNSFKIDRTIPSTPLL
jgi:hypothetical protein